MFYRRGLWPNLAKLIDAEVAYARDDHERADLFLEKARVFGHHAGDPDEARTALDEAVRLSPHHQGALLELERSAARANDVPALLEVWEKLATSVETPARKIGYWIEVGRAAAASNLPRALAAFEAAAALAGPVGATAERVARERLRAVDEHGTPDEVGAAIEALAGLLLAAFGPAGPNLEMTAGEPTLQAVRIARPQSATSSSRCAGDRRSSPARCPAIARGMFCSRRSRSRPASRCCSRI